MWEIDELEAFVLDFLAYRRERRAGVKKHVPVTGIQAFAAPKLIALKDETPETVKPEDFPISPTHERTVQNPDGFRISKDQLYEIGKGWPHYRGMFAKNAGSSTAVNDGANASLQTQQTKPPNDSQAEAIHAKILQSDIIPAMEPIVLDEIARFGPPENHHALTHLVNQVIAKAMVLPPVAESMSVLEIAPWGRAMLLIAVVELLIRLHS